MRETQEQISRKEKRHDFGIGKTWKSYTEDAKRVAPRWYF